MALLLHVMPPLLKVNNAVAVQVSLHGGLKVHALLLLQVQTVHHLYGTLAAVGL